MICDWFIGLSASFFIGQNSSENRFIKITSFCIIYKVYNINRQKEKLLSTSKYKELT